MTVDAEIRKIVAKLSPEERARFHAKVDRVLRHRAAIQRYPTPGHIGQLFRPGWVQTPMLDAIDEAIMSAERGDHLRWIINTPPQEGKTTRLQDGAAYMLVRRPWLRIAFASYEQGVAAQSGLAIRQLLETHGSGYRGQTVNPDRTDSLGLMLDPDRAMQTNWALADVPGRKNMRPGGVLSVGIGSAFTGRPADVLVVDDPLKDAKQADSPVIRRAVKDWYQAVANTRLSSNAIVIIIQTRWHEDDLTGWLLAEDAARTNPQFRHLNIQAQYDGEQEDPLGREVGEYLLSARGRTTDEWERKKVDVGSRWWFALYQGRPSPPEGGIFQRAWFDRNRVADQPEMLHVMTFVDPADNQGDGDEAGIITGGLGTDGHVYILSDDSGHYTVARWVRVALFALMRHGASRLAYEKSLSGLQRSIQVEWRTIRRQARELVKSYEWKPVAFDPVALGLDPKVIVPSRRRYDPDAWPPQPDDAVINRAVDALSDEDDTDVERHALARDLMELWPYVPMVRDMSEMGPPIKRITPRGTKALRAEMVSPMCEQGRVHHVGHYVKLEHQCVTWLPTQDSPDRMDAWVHLLTELGKSDGGSRVVGATGPALPRKQPAMPQILRTTRR